MQEQPLEAVRSAPDGARGVQPVARHGMADGREVDPDLVGPTGDQLQLQQRPASEPLADAVAGDGLPAVGHDGHPQPVAGVAADGRLDAAHLAATEPPTSAR